MFKTSALVSESKAGLFGDILLVNEFFIILLLELNDLMTTRFLVNTLSFPSIALC